jgi:hypothetical protein
MAYASPSLPACRSTLKSNEQKENLKGKVHLTPSNYYFNDNLSPKLSITTIYPTNYQNNDNVPPNASKMTKLPL